MAAVNQARRRRAPSASKTQRDVLHTVSQDLGLEASGMDPRAIRELEKSMESELMEYEEHHAHGSHHIRQQLKEGIITRTVSKLKWNDEDKPAIALMRQEAITFRKPPSIGCHQVSNDSSLTVLEITCCLLTPMR